MRDWGKNIRRVDPYVPGEQPNVEGMIKLNSNENPYPPSVSVKKILEDTDYRNFRFYPDFSSRELVEALAQRHQVNTNQIFVGVGSDDVLAMSFLTFFNSGQPILFPDITYSFYSVWAELYRIPYYTCALDENFRMEKKDYLKKNGGIVIANPNAPTSLCEDLSFIEEIVAHNQDSVVIIDEAYIDFGGESAASLTAKYDNLLVVQTFSKARSLAGMRIGYCIGNESLIEALNDIKNSYNSFTMNQLSIQCGAASVRDEEYFKETLNKIIHTRESTKRALEALGFHVLNSSTNFLFVSHDRVKAKDLFEALKGVHIYIRYFNLPRVHNFLRISIGTDEEMQKMLEFVDYFVKTY